MGDEPSIDAFLERGACCAEAIVGFGLALKGEEDPRFASAASGLCGGMKSGRACGALAGGVLLLSMFDRSAIRDRMIQDLVSWFDDVYGREFGSIDCADIAGERMQRRAAVCASLVKAVCSRCVELLRAHGLT